MRLRPVCLCLMLIALFLAGCSKAYTNPNLGNTKEADAQFERDSVSCDAMAGEKYPLDKRRQADEYRMCMESKGWKARGDFEVYLPEKGKK